MTVRDAHALDGCLAGARWALSDRRGAWPGGTPSRTSEERVETHHEPRLSPCGHGVRTHGAVRVTAARRVSVAVVASHRWFPHRAAWGRALHQSWSFTPTCTPSASRHNVRDGAKLPATPPDHPRHDFLGDAQSLADLHERAAVRRPQQHGIAAVAWQRGHGGPKHFAP